MAERRESVKVTADISSFTTKMAEAGASAKAFARDLDSTDSRMGNLVQTGLALGPALVPIGAVAIPAIAALSAGLGVAVLGAGSAILAFQGIGDALTAANNYAIDPTTANLDAMHKKLKMIGPAGRDMVVFLQDLRPELQNLKDVAGEGLFPGLQDGLTSMLTVMPEVERVVSSVSGALGDIAASAGKGLTSPQWRDFLDFLATDSRQTLTDFADATGNVAGALAGLWQAFDPLNDSFTAKLVTSTQAFEDWSQGLSETQGFQDFTDYLRTSGPQVVDTLASLGNALVKLLEAAAPLGGPTLAVIRAIADTLAAVADSPAGPVLILAASGLSAISRAMALYRVTSGSALMTFLNKGKMEGVAAGAGWRAAGAGIGILALSMTDLDEKAGLSNTASLALLGTIAGPWGAAIGGGIGLVKDFAAGNNDLESAMKAANAAAKNAPFDFAAQAAAMAKSREETQKLADSGSLIDDFVTGLDFLAGPLLSLDDYQDKANKAADANRELAITTMGLQQGVIEFAQALNDQTGLDGFTTNLPKIQGMADQLVPALQGAGYSLTQIQDILLTHKGWDAAVAAAKTYLDAQDSIPGRTTSVADAIAALGGEMTDAATEAENLQTTLDDLFGPELGLIQATDAWTTALRHLSDDLAKHNRTLIGNTDAAIKNRAAITGRVDDFKAIIVAEARAGASGKQLAADILTQRGAFIKAGVAAGIHRGQLVKLLDQIHLTPKLVATIFKALGIDKAEQDARTLRDRYNDLPKEVRTDIAANGVAADATIKSLMSKYDGLSRRQAQTIITALDKASGVIDTVKLNLADLDGRKATTTVTNFIDTVRQTRGAQADGNLLYFYGDGAMRPTIGAQQPQIQPNRGPAGIVWAETGAGPWEAFISGHPDKRDRSRSIADETVARLGGDVQWFAGGGLTGARQRDLLGPVADEFGPRSPIVDAIRQWLSGVTRAQFSQDKLADRITRATAHIVDPALRQLKVGPGMTAHDVRGEVNDLNKTLQSAFGDDARWVKHIDKLGDRVVAATARQDDLQHSLEGLRGDLKNLRQQRGQYRQEVAGSISNDPFTGGLAAFDLQVRADSNDNQKMLHALKEAQSKGLDGALLRAAAGSGDLVFVQELAHLGRKGIHREEVLFNARARAQGALGSFAATAVFGDRVHHMTTRVDHMAHRVDEMTRHIRHLDNNMERAVERGASHGVQQRNHRHATARQANR